MYSTALSPLKLYTPTQPNTPKPKLRCVGCEAAVYTFNLPGLPVAGSVRIQLLDLFGVQGSGFRVEGVEFMLSGLGMYIRMYMGSREGAPCRRLQPSLINLNSTSRTPCTLRSWICKERREVPTLKPRHNTTSFGPYIYPKIYGNAKTN